MKESILFYVDHKHRDLPALSLIGYYLNKLGYLVLFAPIWKWKVANCFDVIIVNKPVYKEFIKWKKNRIVMIIETEGANQDINFKRNIKYYPHLYFFWSNKECDKYIDELLINDTNFSVKGSPRLDLLLPKFKDNNNKLNYLDNNTKYNTCTIYIKKIHTIYNNIYSIYYFK